MISAASSLILLARIPAGSIHSPLTPYLLMLVSIAAVYGGWMWMRAPDELTAAVLADRHGIPGVAAAPLQSRRRAVGCRLLLAAAPCFCFPIKTNG